MKIDDLIPSAASAASIVVRVLNRNPTADLNLLPVDDPWTMLPASSWSPGNCTKGTDLVYSYRRS